jgi:hypothetical protein
VVEAAPPGDPIFEKENVPRQKSPIRGVHYKPSSVDITLLDIDETNPGSDKYSARYQKRETPINESYDILGMIVYPLVISERGDGSGRFWIVDGHGRYDELTRRGATTVSVLHLSAAVPGAAHSAAPDPQCRPGPI